MTREEVIDTITARADNRLMPDQRSTGAQLRDLERVAVMMGMYDASDAIKRMLTNRKGDR